MANLEYILFYDPKEPYGWGSNFYKLKKGVVINGETWRDTEAYFQAMKFRGRGATARSVEYSNLIREADSPMKVKMLGTQRKNMRFGKKWKLNKNTDHRIVNDLIDQYKDVKMRDDWDNCSIRAMLNGLYYKFTQYPELKKELMSISDNSILVEHTTRDSRWGDGGDGGTGEKGTNYLGKLLTALSYVFKNESCDSMSDELKKKLRIKKIDISSQFSPLISSMSNVSEKKNKIPIHRCIKVANLRKYGYESLKDWMSDKKNLYVGRSGRIFITHPDKSKEIFHYSGSKWQNPYKVGEGEGKYTIIESLRLYEKYIREGELYNQLNELLEYKELGCFCDEKNPCHAKVLIKLLEEPYYKKYIEESIKGSGKDIAGLIYSYNN